MEEYLIHKCDILMSRIRYSNITKFTITWIAVHGMTDIFTETELLMVMYNHFFCTIIIYYFKPLYRFIILIILSIYHIRLDLGITGSIILHISWFLEPKLAIPYFAAIHVPLHYYRHINIIGIYELCLLNLIVPLSYILIPDSVYMSCRSFLWVAPVMGHIIITK